MPIERKKNPGEAWNTVEADQDGGPVGPVLSGISNIHGEAPEPHLAFETDHLTLEIDAGVILDVDGAGGGLHVGATGGKLGFYGAALASKPTINTADSASIIAALVTLGLVNDNT